MDIVLIPCYYRPEYLSLCLEYLSKAEGARNNKEYWVCQDYRFQDDHRYGIQARWTKEVVDNSPIPVRFVQRQPHGYTGNSMNTLEAYKEAFQTDAKLIYLVEEDVLVSPDFFRWHEAVVANGSYFCSVAYRCARNGGVDKTIDSSEAYFESKVDFASIGVCWPRENLRAVVEHAKPEYYADMGGYLDSRFPNDVYSGWYHEQDGLVMRVLHEQKGTVAWAYRPRAFHVGNVGYHRPNGKRGDGQLQDKVSFLKSWIYDAEKIKLVAPDFGDIEPVPVEFNPTFGALRKVQEF